jgi:hypothetical protein
MNQQHRYPQTTYKEMSFDWRGLAGACIAFPFLYLTGPLYFLSLLLQRWAAASVWKAPDRWASLRTFSWLCPLLYLPTWLFWHQIAIFWSAHLPGDFLLWPPTFGAIILRSVLALPLAPALALLLERQRPHTLTMRHMVRRPRPGEVIGPMQQEQEEEPQRLSPAKDGQVPQPEKPAETPARTPTQKNQPGAGATKSKSASSTQPVRKRTGRDPRPVGIVWAEQAQEERRSSAAQLPATPPPEQPERQATRKVVEPEEDQAEESTMPDPFKARKINWKRVKE